MPALRVRVLYGKRSDKSDFIQLFQSDFIRLFKIRSTALVTPPNRMNFRKGSKLQLTPTPTPQNGPYLIMCMLFHTIWSPCLLAYMMQPYLSAKICNIFFWKWAGGVEGRLEFFRKFIQLGSGTLPIVRGIVRCIVRCIVQCITRCIVWCTVRCIVV